MATAPSVRRRISTPTITRSASASAPFTARRKQEATSSSATTSRPTPSSSATRAATESPLPPAARALAQPVHCAFPSHAREKWGVQTSIHIRHRFETYGWHTPYPPLEGGSKIAERDF